MPPKEHPVNANINATRAPITTLATGAMPEIILSDTECRIRGIITAAQTKPDRIDSRKIVKSAALFNQAPNAPLFVARIILTIVGERIATNTHQSAGFLRSGGGDALSLGASSGIRDISRRR
jgi:hypothetical protein